MTRQTLTLLTVICALGAAGVVLAQDDVENPNGIDTVSAVNDVSPVDDVNTVDNDVGNEPSPPEKSSKKSKSKPKSGKSDESVSITEKAATETASAGKSKTEKAAAEGTTLKFNGLVAAGVDINSKENKKAAGKKAEAMVSKRVVKGELELSAQPVKKVRAEMGIEYNANGRVMVADSLRLNMLPEDPQDPNDGNRYVTDIKYELLKGLGLGPFLTIDKIYAQYNIVDNGQIRAGVMKKAFGLEERAGLDERCFLKRSIINEGLETLGFLDHDLTLAYRHDLLNDALRLTGAFSWSVIDSLAYLQNYSAHYRPAPNMEFILAGIVRHYAANDTLELPNSQTRLPALLTAFAASLSFRYDAAVCVSEAEATVGTNPDILLTQNRTALLLGVRLQEQFPKEIDNKILRRVTPAAEAAVYTADIDSSHIDTQFKFGVTLGFAKNSAFQFRNNFGMIFRKPKNGDFAVRRYRFDSEAVVVF